MLRRGSPIPPEHHNYYLQMKRRSAVYENNFIESFPGTSEPSFSRQSSMPCREVNRNLGAIPRVPRNPVRRYSEVERVITPEPRLAGRQNSFTASMKKLRSKVNSVIDRLNLSFSDNREPVYEDPKVLSSPGKSSPSEMKADRILSSGGNTRKKLGTAGAMMRALQPKNLFKKFGKQKDRDVDDRSPYSSIPSLTSDNYTQTTPEMDAVSGKVLMYDDMNKSIVCHPFSEAISDEAKFTEEVEVHVHRPDFYQRRERTESNGSSASQASGTTSISETYEVPAVAENINRRFVIQESLHNFRCSPDHSNHSSESKSSCSQIVHPSWSDEQLDSPDEGEYIMIRRECRCARFDEQQEDTGENNSGLDEIDGFVMVENKEDDEKDNPSYVLSISNPIRDDDAVNRILRRFDDARKR